MDLGDLAVLGLTFVVVTIVLSIGAAITNQVRDTQTANSYAYNVSNYGLSGLNTFGTWLPIVAIAIVATVIIGIIMKGFGGLASGV
jgi:hypothetical protein